MHPKFPPHLPTFKIDRTSNSYQPLSSNNTTSSIFTESPSYYQKQRQRGDIDSQYKMNSSDINEATLEYMHYRFVTTETYEKLTRYIDENLKRYNDIYDYAKDVENAVKSRMEKYEQKQSELELLLRREKLLEASTRRLLSLNLWLAILSAATLILTFITFCFLHQPNDVANFISDAKIIVGGFTVVTIFSLIKPLLFLHSMDKRLKDLEDKMD